MDNINRQLNKLPRAKMSLVKKVNLKYKLYVLIVQGSFNFDFLLSRKFQYRAISFILLLSLLFGIPMYSYASPGVNEQHILYPVKLAIENIELKTANTEIKEQEKYEKFSERRLSEAEVLSEDIRGDEDRAAISSTIKNAIFLKEKARDIVIDQNGEESFEFRQREKLNNIAAQVGIKESEDLVEDIAVAMDEIQENLSRNNNKKNEIMGDASPEDLNYGQQKKENSNIVSETENTQRLLDLKETVQALKTDLEGDKYDEVDVEVLFERLDRRIEIVDESIENETPKNINGIINSTKAITNNAKHFIKIKSPESSTRGNSGKMKLR